MFELRSLNRSLQQKALNTGEDGIPDSPQAQPLSLLSEIQQSQVSHTSIHTHTHTHLQKCLCPIFFASNQAKEALLAHSSVLQAKDEEIEMLKEEVCLLFSLTLTCMFVTSQHVWIYRCTYTQSD